MTNRLFSATGALCHAGPKRVRRRWWHTAVNLLMLLALAALAALAGWLWSCVRQAAGPAVAVPGLAMAPLGQGLVMGALLSFSAVGIWLAVVRMRREDEAAARGRGAVPAPAEAGTAMLGEDPLGLPAEGLTRAELRRIVDALGAEAREVRAILRLMEVPAGELALEGMRGVAVQRLAGMRTCLLDLAARLAELETTMQGAAHGEGEP